MRLVIPHHSAYAGQATASARPSCREPPCLAGWTGGRRRVVVSEPAPAGASCPVVGVLVQRESAPRSVAITRTKRWLGRDGYGVVPAAEGPLGGACSPVGPVAPAGEPRPKGHSGLRSASGCRYWAPARYAGRSCRSPVVAVLPPRRQAINHTEHDCDDGNPQEPDHQPRSVRHARNVLCRRPTVITDVIPRRVTARRNRSRSGSKLR
jgi:hypothetical protein